MIFARNLAYCPKTGRDADVSRFVSDVIEKKWKEKERRIYDTNYH